MKISDEKVSVWGRYFTQDGFYIFDNVCSGIEVKFFGTELSIDCKTIARPRINPDYPMFTVLSIQIDDNNPFMFNIKNEEGQKVTILSGLKNGSHIIKILKTDDPLISSFCVSDVYTDGYFEDKVQHKYNMAVYGDSIISGGDSLIGDGPSLNVVPGTGDGTRTYATLAAKAIDAKVDVLCRCGLCLYPASSMDTEIVITKTYNKVSTQNLIDWDLNKFIPDIVVIGLGTNDELGNMFTIENFAKAYENFIKDIAKYNEKALFVLTYGYMNKDDSVEKAISMVVQNLQGKYWIKTVKLPKAKKGHPSIREHIEGSKLLIDLLIRGNFC